jgi:hypothetical protein
MKRPQKTRTKRQPKRNSNQPLEFPKTHNRAKAHRAHGEKSHSHVKYPQVGLPPNEKLRKFADELYGDMGIPFRKHN